VFALLGKLEKTIKIHFPELLDFIGRFGLDLCCLFSGCYMTLFSYANPSFRMGSRITDLFLLVGPPILNSLIMRMIENSLNEIYQQDLIENFKTFFKEILINKMEYLLE
jgi:hypothetical protein